MQRTVIAACKNVLELDRKFGGGAPFRVSNKPLILRTHSVEILNAIAS